MGQSVGGCRPFGCGCFVGDGCAAQVGGDRLAQCRPDGLSAGRSQKPAEGDLRFAYGLSEGLHVGC